MNQKQIIENLKERVKELTSLYDIASLAAQHEQSLEDTLVAIAGRLPYAWRYPEQAMAEITIPGIRVFSRQPNDETIVQQAMVRLSGEDVGVIRIHYPKDYFKEIPFLKEEQQLLEKIAQEVSVIIERQKNREREEWYQKKFQHSDRLALLGEMTAGIAHELNTPLTSIIGYSEFIKKNSSDGQVKEDAERIHAAAMFSREIVKKLMFFSAAIPQKKVKTNLNVLVGEAIKLLKPNFNKARVAINFVADPRNPKSAIDPVQITQVLFNLIINALYASKTGGAVEVEIFSNTSTFRLKVADQGIGMTEEVRAKIFEPFFTTKPLGKGSGLGLSVIHGIVKSHGGSITVQSAPGKGSTFVVEIPLNAV